MNFLTHFHVLRFLKTLELPSCIQETHAWTESIEFLVEPLNSDSYFSVFSFLKQHFQKLFEQESDTVAYIYYGDPERKYHLKVCLHEYLDFDQEYDDNDNPLPKKIPTLTPTWRRLYQAANSKTIYKIDPLSSIIPTACFYSLKGNLSARCLTLDALCQSYLEKLCGLYNPKVLVIDADLKSPNLNWFDSFYELNVNTSFAELIEVWECNGLDCDYSWSFVKEIAQKPTKWGTINNVYFLPAFNHYSQIIYPNSYPDAFVVHPGESWSVINKINILGKKLGVDCILINLESGMGDSCKWNAPILFDPRVHKAICSTLPPSKHFEDLEVNLVLSLMQKLSKKLDFNLPFIMPDLFSSSLLC